MASIYLKGSKKTLILEPREGLYRQFDFGDWTELRIGMFTSVIAATGPDDNSVNETIVPADFSDYITFGIKNASVDLPGFSGALYLGLRNRSNTSCTAGAGIGGPSGGWRGFTADGTTTEFGSIEVGAQGFMGDGSPTASTGYAGFKALKFVINNRGLANQSVSMSMSGTDAGVAGNDYTRTPLRTLINNASYIDLGTFDWNDGVAARDIPDSFFVRSPMFLNRLRIAAIRAIRYA